MKRKVIKRTAEQRERIIKEIQEMGVVAGCRKHEIYASTYYKWLDKYMSNGLKGLEDRRQVNVDRELKKKEKEIRLLKQILAEKELKIQMQKELIEKKYKAWKKNVR